MKASKKSSLAEESYRPSTTLTNFLKEKLRLLKLEKDLKESGLESIRTRKEEQKR